MPLLITVHRRDGASVLHLQGRLVAESVEELRRAWKEAGGAIEIDLSGLAASDEVGIAFLQGLQQAGVVLRNSNPYFAALLQQVP